MDLNYHVLSQGILGLSTNVASLSWSFGRRAPRAGREEFEACRLRLQCLVRSSRSLRSDYERTRSDSIGRYHYFSGQFERGEVFYRRHFMLGSDLLVRAQGLDGDVPTLEVNPTYRRWVAFRFMNLSSMEYLLEDLTVFLLLLRGFAPLHCSAMSLSDRTLVVLGPPQAGKTMIVLEAVLGKGATFISEDIALTDGENVYGVPWTSSFRYPSKDISRSFQSIRRRAERALPILELLPGSRKSRVDELIPLEQIGSSGRITDLVLLESGKESVERITEDEMLRRLTNLSRFGFNYAESPLNNAYSYFNPAVDVSDACNAEKRILKNLAGNVRSRFLVRGRSPVMHAETICELSSDKVSSTGRVRPKLRSDAGS